MAYAIENNIIVNDHSNQIRYLLELILSSDNQQLFHPTIRSRPLNKDLIIQEIIFDCMCDEQKARDFPVIYRMIVTHPSVKEKLDSLRKVLFRLIASNHDNLSASCQMLVNLDKEQFDKAYNGLYYDLFASDEEVNNIEIKMLEVIMYYAIYSNLLSRSLYSDRTHLLMPIRP